MPVDIFCRCDCRQTMRFLNIGLTNGYIGDSWFSMNDLLTLWKQNIDQYIDFVDCLVKTINKECAKFHFERLSSCQCCQRHISNRPENLF
jgi:hypothetical protein